MPSHALAVNFTTPTLSVVAAIASAWICWSASSRLSRLLVFFSAARQMLRGSCAMLASCGPAPVAKYASGGGKSEPVGELTVTFLCKDALDEINRMLNQHGSARKVLEVEEREGPPQMSKQDSKSSSRGGGREKGGKSGGSGGDAPWRATRESRDDSLRVTLADLELNP